MPDTIVVTGCDENHDGLVQELLLSLHDLPQRDFAIGFIRLGLGDVPAPILAAVDKGVRAVGDAGVPTLDEGFLTAYLGVRSRLPELFPGYQTYIWLDGDTWVQNAAGVAQIVEAAGRSDFAAATETDGAYWRNKTPSDHTLTTYSRIYGEGEAAALSRYPMINAGVFGARVNSRLWATWNQALADSRGRQVNKTQRYFSDQIPLHRMVTLGHLEFHPLRPVNNWMVMFAPPSIDFDSRKLRTPTLPGEEINIVHLAGMAKSEEYRLGRGEEKVSFRYKRMRSLLGLEAA